MPIPLSRQRFHPILDNRSVVNEGGTYYQTRSLPTSPSNYNLLPLSSLLMDSSQNNNHSTTDTTNGNGNAVSPGESTSIKLSVVNRSPSSSLKYPHTSAAVQQIPATLFERSSKGQVRRPTRPEHVIAFEFLKLHYEEDPQSEIPIQKSDVYQDYDHYCTQHNYKPLVAADFGRILKSMFPKARDRRLGSRGSSKYCYVGVRRKDLTDQLSPGTQCPYSTEDLYNAYQTIICEWASTVLSRKMTTVDELAKYLLRNRFVQTRSCAALTLTAHMRDSEEDMTADSGATINKHRETQLKLQEKLREKLLNKSNMDPSAVSYRSGYDLQTACSSALSSTRTTPEPRHQSVSQPGSRQPSPVHSLNSSARTSPVFTETFNLMNHYSNGSYGQDMMSLPGDNPPPPSYNTLPQSNGQMSHTGSRSNTPAYGQPYTYDPRIHSAPNTPISNYYNQNQQRFDFSQQSIANRLQSHQLQQQQQQQQQSVQPLPQQPQHCMSLPASARSTPVKTERIEHPYPTQGTDYFNQDISTQRLGLGQHNSAFMPIREDSSYPPFYQPQSQPINNSLDHTNQLHEVTTQSALDAHTEEQAELTELLSIIDPENQKSSSAHGHNYTYEDNDDKRSSSVKTLDLSASAVTTVNRPNPSTGGVLHTLLTKPSTRLDRLNNTRFRHHSGPPLGAHSNQKFNSISTLNFQPSTSELISPPSTPIGNFRPVNAAPLGRQECTGYNSGQFTPALPRHIPTANTQTNMAGTMSPPSQPLNKRKRQHSGELMSQRQHIELPVSPLTSNHVRNCKPFPNTNNTQTEPHKQLSAVPPAALQGELQSKRNLLQLSNSKLTTAENHMTDKTASSMAENILTPPTSARVTPDNQSGQS